MSIKDERVLIREKAVFVDLKFMDLHGTWQHITVPAKDEFTGENIEKGFGFDGSSIRGWQAIDESDMLLKPDMETITIEPFYPGHASVICDIIDPVVKQPYNRDPRWIAKKAEKYLQETGIGDVAYFGPEAEFFIFDNIDFSQNDFGASYKITSTEKIRKKEGYIPVPPLDTFQALRSEMITVMATVGIHVEKHHHEVAATGQAEIDLRYQPLVKMGDQMSWYKYIVKNVADKNGKTATFMPKPVFGDNGSGMHTHQSIWKNETPLFAGDQYAGMSELALYYIGGILKHAKALVAIVAPTTNSYKRLVPGFEAPVNLVYSSRNRSAAVRIPMYEPENKKAKRIEVRFPDPACNPYLAFAAMLMAGIDGIENKINPGKPVEGNIYELENSELKQLPGSLSQSIAALENDNAFLLKGNVFTENVVSIWIERKKKEIQESGMYPTPWEFKNYFDV